MSFGADVGSAVVCIMIFVSLWARSESYSAVKRRYFIMSGMLMAMTFFSGMFLVVRASGVFRESDPYLSIFGLDKPILEQVTQALSGGEVTTDAIIFISIAILTLLTALGGVYFGYKANQED